MSRWRERRHETNPRPSLRAKRSNPLPRKERMDCFVAALLAMTGRVRGGMKRPSPVIASAAKQSILSLRGKMDCFASLAMTGEGLSHAASHASDS